MSKQWMPSALILLILASLLSPSQCWEGQLKKGTITEMQREVMDLVDDVEERSNLIAVIAYNAHPSFFKKCKKCADIAQVMTQLAEAYSEQWWGEHHVRFINVQYTPATQSLSKALSVSPPALILLKPDSEKGIPLDMIALRQAIKDKQSREEGTAANPSEGQPVLFPTFEAAKEKRKARRLQKQFPIASVVNEEEQWMHRLSPKTVVAWIETETGVSITDIPTTATPEEPESSPIGSQLTMTQMVIISGGFSSVLLLIYRAIQGPSNDPDVDEIQRFARVHSWYYLTFFHALFMGGIHWCILNDAAPTGESFVAPRSQGQYLFEGCMMVLIYLAGSVAFLAPHRPENKGVSPEITNIEAVIFVFTGLITILIYLRKNFWYMSGTWVRSYIISVVIGRK
eukprot:TRINITY_DN21073_c0_g1_i1.p1 TRINITY_DN21073_c0_g1~~TRINITY_DN21073_c0_g1_i1.p1  ORF type:complete len:411 (+),score=65.25 TRINITY_DN21073_c0_g1_i1:39-1235(+)